MKLVIAEKPMLARAISDAIEGKEISEKGYVRKGDYVIVSAFGHLLTLKEPEDYDSARYRKWSLDTLPIYFDDWGKKPGEGKEERLELIGKLIGEADEIIHAGDPDDEGQYLIDEIIDWFGYKGKVSRLSTGDTTKAALAKALKNMKDNSEFVNSGWSAHARSVSDIMVGYNFSRYFSLMNSHVKMLTVGRVQTPTLGLVVARDLLIENHIKQTYAVITADLDIDGHSVAARWEPAKDDPNLEDGKITDTGYANDIAEALKGSSFEGIQITEKDITEQPPLPFNLVKLQTYCSAKFGYDPSKTLEITQVLRDSYNAITYNRSDCQYLSEEQYKEAPGTVKTVLSNLKDDPAGKVFQRFPLDTSLHSKAFDDRYITAHTAIIPQNRSFDVSKLSEEQKNVYLAIVKYYMAQFLPPAKKERTTLEVPAEGGTLRASSTKTVSPGYLTLIRPEKGQSDEEEEENELSLIAPGTYDGVCTDSRVEEKQTQAPPRYTKASLNEDMTRIAKYVTDPEAKRLLMAKDRDKKGENGSIGTSATRSFIIDNLENRGFIESKGKQIISTQLGRELCRILPEELIKPDMTGYWWAIQEEIQDGEVPWTALTDSVLKMIKEVLGKTYPKVDAYHIPPDMRKGILLLGTCPRCGGDIIEGTRGYGCRNFMNGCKFVIWKEAKSGMMSRTTVTADMVHGLLSSGWTDETRTEEDGTVVPTGRKRTVGTVAVKKLWSESKGKTYPGNIYLADEGPSSPYGASFMLESIINEPPKSLGKCPRCGSDVIEGKNGFGCSGYADGCRFVIWKKAKSGMLAKTRITKGLVKTLLKSPWTEETKEDENGTAVPTGRMRTEKTVHIKKLWSEAKGKTYSGDVYLADEGKDSQYGASFVLAGFSANEPEVLGKCPRCGRDVLENSKAYSCTGYQEGACSFAIWKKQKQTLLQSVTFTKTDAKRFLSGKTTRKRKLTDRKGREFTAELMMEEDPSNPYGPVFRVVEGTIEVKEGDPSEIKTVTVEYPPKEKTE